MEKRKKGRMEEGTRETGDRGEWKIELRRGYVNNGPGVVLGYWWVK
jgi:hypothetical protein